MTYNIIDTDLLELNDNIEIQFLQGGQNNNHTILIIDNFLKNPEYLISILESFPIEKNSTHWWGHQLPFDWKFPKLRNAVNFLAREYFNVTHVKDVSSEIALQFNLVPGNKDAWNSNMVPHIDQAVVAGSIFLNDDKDCRGGTGFYKHKKSNIDYEISYVDETFKETAHYWAINETYKLIKEHDHIVTFDSRKINADDWELQFIAEAKYNRFVMHPSYIFHAPYIEKDWYLNKERISLAVFVT
jgi:Family of unknown function (DUF6445)